MTSGRDRNSTDDKAVGPRPLATVVVASRYGQLCNRLLTFANLAVFASRERSRVINASFCDYAHLFQAFRNAPAVEFPQATGSLCIGSSVTRRSKRIFWRLLERACQAGRLPPRSFHVLQLPNSATYQLGDDGFRELLRAKRYLFLSGMAVAAPTFAQDFPVLKGLFCPHSEYMGRIAELVSSAREGSETLVGVHVRRGDYASYRGGEWFYDWADYAGLVRRVAAMFSGRRISFLIVSNETVPRELFSGFNCSFSGEREIVDLYALSHCDYILGPPSTFSAWAAMYGCVPVWHVRSKSASPGEDSFRRIVKVW